MYNEQLFSIFERSMIHAQFYYNKTVAIGINNKFLYTSRIRFHFKANGH